MSPRKFNRILLVGATSLLAACATIPPPDYSRGHPANPDAQAAPVEPLSVTLSSYRPGGVGSKSDPAPSGAPNGDAGHGALVSRQGLRKVSTMTSEPTLRPRLCLVLSVLALGGCTTVQREAQLPEVREAVGQRIGQTSVWNQKSEQDREVQEAVRRLLRSE